MLGPITARREAVSAPHRWHIAATSAPAIPARVPRQPAWASAMMRCCSIDNNQRHAIGEAHHQCQPRLSRDDAVGIGDRIPWREDTAPSVIVPDDAHRGAVDETAQYRVLRATVDAFQRSAAVCPYTLRVRSPRRETHIPTNRRGSIALGHDISQPRDRIKGREGDERSGCCHGVMCPLCVRNRGGYDRSGPRQAPGHR